MAIRSVWLVDDDELSNFVNEKIIKIERFAQNLLSFTDVGEALLALELASRQQEVSLPDVVFLDMEMPGLDGWDFLEAFEQLPEQVKTKIRLYMLTSSIDETDKKRAREYHYLKGFISKPLTPKGLELIGNNFHEEARQTGKE